ncbi:putative glycerol kinase 5 isoform X2 [Halyomorpha halys]|uniref:putative glycerol kinase 5 isoform X2 n=1 Tax=Halyomorpha halys TaxID=286706 RepID=UPI0006D4D5B0|nr:putative glycerol kinase 5 isoform X2 [Halyomorpha halys]
MHSKRNFIAAIDIGTSNIRCLIYDKTGKVKGLSKSSVKLLIPQPGFVEIAPEDLWETLLDVVYEAVGVACIKFDDISSIGISSQRNSFILWDKYTGKSYHNFIAWNDIRAESIVNKENCSIKMKVFNLFSKGLYLITRNPRFLLGSMYKLTNAQITPRLLWVMKHNFQVARDLLKNTVAFGTIDSWLLYKLSGKAIHVIDVSNASATGLFDPFLLTWSPWPFKLFGIPMNMFPKIVDSAGCHFGCTDATIFGVSIPIHCSIADQSASLLGSGCFQWGDTKLTLGTGTFLNVNTGDKPHTSFNGLYPLVAWKFNKEVVYMAEGASNDTGVVLQWAQRLRLLDDLKDSEHMAHSVKNNHGVYFVPAFSGLQAPINDATAAAGFIGLKLTTIGPHLIRAMLESIVYRVFCLFRSFYDETDFNPKFIRFLEKETRII